MPTASRALIPPPTIRLRPEKRRFPRRARPHRPNLLTTCRPLHNCTAPTLPAPNQLARATSPSHRHHTRPPRSPSAMPKADDSRAQRPLPLQDTSPLIANKRRYTPIPGWSCADCSKSETPVRRHGPQGPRTLCNACGLRRAKRRKQEEIVAAAAAAAGLPTPPLPPAPKTRRRRASSSKRSKKPATHQPKQSLSPGRPKSRPISSSHPTQQPRDQLTASQSKTSLNSAPSAPTIKSPHSSPISPDELLHCSLVSTPPSPRPAHALSHDVPPCASLLSLPQPCASPVSASSTAPASQLTLNSHDCASMSPSPTQLHLPSQLPCAPVAQPLPHPANKLHAPAEPMCWRQNDVALFDSILEGSSTPASMVTHPVDCADLLPSPVAVIQDVLSADLFDPQATNSPQDMPPSMRAVFDVYADPAASLDAILTQSATASDPATLAPSRIAPDNLQVQLRSLHALFTDNDSSRSALNGVTAALHIDPTQLMQLDNTERSNVPAFA